MERLVIDRLISGAGAVAAGADEFARGFGESEPRLIGRRPAAVPVAILLLALAGLLLLVGIETTSPPSFSSLRAGDLAGDGGPGQQTHATVSGSLASTVIADVQGTDRTGDAWFYLLVDPTDRRGIVVRSERPPSAVFTSRMRGVVVDDPTYVKDDVAHFKDDTDELGLTLDPSVYIDATVAPSGSAEPLDLAGTPPTDGTPVEISGSRLVDYWPNCSNDANGDGTCTDAQADGFDVIVYDPVGKRAMTVLTRTSPAFTDATMTGMLTRNEQAVDGAEGSGPIDVGEYQLEVSPHYLLDDGATPPDSPLAFLLAAGLALLGGVILAGSVGGYLVYHRAAGPLPEPRSTMAPGERLPLRVTGFIHTPCGRVHVREAPAELVRFVLRPAVVQQGDAQADAQPGTDAPAELVADVPASTTLVIERSDYPHGVSIGLGELVRLSAGEVTPLRGPRPALRAVGGTGQLLLSFDAAADRDRAASELLDESGLGQDGRSLAVTAGLPAPA